MPESSEDLSMSRLAITVDLFPVGVPSEDHVPGGLCMCKPEMNTVTMSTGFETDAWVHNGMLTEDDYAMLRGEDSSGG